MDGCTGFSLGLKERFSPSRWFKPVYQHKRKIVWPGTLFRNEDPHSRSILHVRRPNTGTQIITTG